MLRSSHPSRRRPSLSNDSDPPSQDLYNVLWIFICSSSQLPFVEDVSKCVPGTSVRLPLGLLLRVPCSGLILFLEKDIRDSTPGGGPFDLSSFRRGRMRELVIISRNKLGREGSRGTKVWRVVSDENQ